MSGENEAEPHAYIHIPPEKVGEKFQRYVVPVSALRKFDYAKYAEDSTMYNKKLVKYKDDTGKKIKCYVLYAAESFDSVQSIIDSGKRFGIPAVIHDQSADGVDDSSLMNNENVDNNNIQKDKVLTEKYKIDAKRAKSTRKNLKKTKVQTSDESDQRILNKYLSTVTNLNNNENLHDVAVDDSLSEIFSSTVKSKEGDDSNNPKKTVSMMDDEELDHLECKSIIKAYKNQLYFFKKKYEESQKQSDEWKLKYENAISSGNCKHSSMTDGALLEYYDKLYNYSGPLQMDDDSDCVKLLHNVECNTIAYKDAFKSSKPIQLVRLLMYGIYGYEDLVTRCQKNEKETAGLQPLCKVRSESIERELYRFLRLNNYNVQLIKQELQEIDKYYHNALSCAKLKKNAMIMHKKL
ncbi:uncharacterized protein LOC116417992 [Nasonia vitripennis]|uniref:Uncharacterized protein n=1 Tax=Nasonia vitripennis TaxID=7425 RepID=A0A7M7QN56_NASVI|nr:uncharacterized protein LOC116417992 [Nasonia vitripennis]